MIYILEIINISPLRVGKVDIFTLSLLYKGLIGNDTLRIYDILVTHTEFLDKICKLLVLMSYPNKEYRIRVILKYASDIADTIRLKYLAL